MTDFSSLLGDLFLLFLAAQIGGIIAVKLRQPAVIGELVAGAVIGPFALGLVGHPSSEMIAFFQHPEDAEAAIEVVFHLIAELGVIILLFTVGLETRLSVLLAVGRRAFLVAVSGVVVPFLFGYLLMTMLGWDGWVPLFTATALVATSVGITARVLRDLGVIGSQESRIILAAAVIDDILAMVLLAIVGGLASSGSLTTLGLSIIVVKAVAFVALFTIAGTGLMRRYHLHLDRLPVPNAPFVVTVLLMLGLAALATVVGLAAIIGAFLAGMILAEASEQYEIERQALPLYRVFVPFFFVITGMFIDWRLFFDPSILALAGVITALALSTKLLACGASVYGLGLRSMAIVGVGMVPRGEVAIIVATLGLGAGLIPHSIFSVVIVMGVLTTIVVPPVLAWLYRGRSAEVGQHRPSIDAISDL
jgi:Kef-type K+ transport system membrane component KefB